jgi:hypothetical protein
MSFTNNKNFIGNYNLEQIAIKKQEEYHLYKNAPNGSAHTTYFPGQGLLPARIAPNPMTEYACDIESFLYGISSTNFITDRKTVYNNLNIEREASNIGNVKSLNIIEKSISGITTESNKTSPAVHSGEAFNPSVVYNNRVCVPSPISIEINSRPIIR